MASRKAGEKKEHRKGQGVRYEAQSRELIWNVFNYFEAQRAKSSNPGKDSIQRTSEATRII
jgi:hypothetical protein